MPERHDAVVVGAGWAGLSVGCMLGRAGLDYVILERDRICETWRTQRWDSFRMNTPNVLTILPGDRYDGTDPEGYMTRDEFVDMVEGYVRRNHLLVQEKTEVREVRPADGGYVIRTSRGTTESDCVVVATGNLNLPRWPELANRFPASVKQIDGTAFRSAAALPPGAVLVIGCGNTGGQIAEELTRDGRRVFLATGRNGRVPRTYRGRDIFLWLTDNGRMAKPRTTETGRGLIGATHTISLQSLSAQGVKLLGRLKDCTSDGRLSFHDSLAESVAFGDEMSAMLKREIDDFVACRALAAPDAVPDPAETVAAEFPDPPITEIDLNAEGITNVIWAVGLRGDFGWLKVPGALDAKGNPVEDRCISVPGLYFAGLDSLASLRAGTVLAAADDANRIVDDIVARLPNG
ncbi:NAD(P)/FAD-dependent oxidoreductase [Paralimibaculum aggregatum]|uniref:NAD(P)/FAD-dependent oxidoreductase n=1 Tax=Paralimibaculum aggregatum TaxID=3036245 RepID=A0ABQ6LMS1_9RHOB|nr:NAD(P)/FAD-dependent oxidoreductase [Limibaculum sp. NKW23]GMG84514.1 NAD(P)/FAD-dependent oxidoreductase [Limibaculum sp. NKW23]